MRIQDAVLDALEKNRGEYLSGEQLASSLGVSRNAVWKAIQKLEEAGHKIRAVPKRGYTLAPESDVLTVQSVSRFLDTDMSVYLQVQTEVTSTNTLLKAQAEQGAPEGTVLIAESQTAGKGRLGRHFTSPPGTGIYFSLLLRPHCTAEKSLFITTTAAVAVCEAIEQVTGLNPQIKWVNDVYLNEKKVCGILTEASVDFENGGLNWAVLGIGINIAVPEDGFPEEIRSISLSAYPTALDITDNHAPKTVYGCKFSMQYCVAAALLFGEVGTEAFCEEHIQNAEIIRLMSLTSTRAIKISDDAAEVNYSEIEIEMRDGTRYQKTVRYAPGDPKNPMSFEDMCRKFSGLVGKACGEEQKKALIRLVETLETAPDVAMALAECG